MKLYIMKDSIRYGSTVSHHTFEWHEPWWIKEYSENRGVEHYVSLSNLHNEDPKVWHSCIETIYVEVLWK